MAKKGKQRQAEYIERLKKDPIKYAEYLEGKLLYTKIWLERDENKRLSSLLSAHSKRDKLKGREFNLTMKWCRGNIIGRECNYCGTKELVGVDRINNNLGHIESNCHPVCKLCNVLRGKWRSHEEMLEFRKLVDLVGFEEAREKTLPSRYDKLERKKKYRINNKEKVAESSKKFREENKARVAEWSKKFREENKEKIAENSKKFREENKEKLAKKQKEYYKENKEKMSQRRKKYYEENKENIIERSKKYYEENKEKVAENSKKYREENKEKIIESKKRYYLENKERIDEEGREYYKKNKETIVERSKKYYEENKEKILSRQKELREIAINKTFSEG